MMPSQPSVIRKWAKPLLVVVVVAILASVVYFVFFAQKPEKVAREFATMVQQGDAEVAYDKYASQAFKQATPKEDWLLLTSRIKNHIEGNLSLNSELSADSRYVFDIEGTPYSLTVDTEKDDGVKVRYFSSDRL